LFAETLTGIKRRLKTMIRLILKLIMLESTILFRREQQLRTTTTTKNKAEKRVSNPCRWSDCAGQKVELKMDCLEREGQISYSTILKIQEQRVGTLTVPPDEEIKKQTRRPLFLLF
jgi:hypothetical protein